MKNSPETASLDLRSLALARILTGLVLVWDVFSRALHLSAHYGPSGIFPAGASGFTLHRFGGWGLWWLFALHLTLALCLLLGVQTRQVSIGCWLLTWSVQQRNPALNFGADSVLVLVLLWGCFLPWGRVWSVDARRSPPRDFLWSGGAISAVWLAQISTLYLFTALRKSGPLWLSGEALPYALANWQVETAPGRALLGLILAAPWVGKLGTWLALALEFAVPVLIWTRWRNLGAGLIIAFHLALAVLFNLGIFPWICLALGVSLLSGEFWKRIAKTEGGPALGSSPRWASALALGLFGLPFLVGFVAIFEPRLVPPTLKRGLAVAGLSQTWEMFSPDPAVRHGWYSARGTRLDGSQVELLLLDREQWERRRPKDLTRDVGGVRWSAVGAHLFAAKDLKWAPPLADFLKRRWESQHPFPPLREIEFFYFEEPVLPRGSSVESVEVVVYRRSWPSFKSKDFPRSGSATK